LSEFLSKSASATDIITGRKFDTRSDITVPSKTAMVLELE